MSVTAESIAFPSLKKNSERHLDIPFKTDGYINKKSIFIAWHTNCNGENLKQTKKNFDVFV
jgi:hypothetical protein